MKLITNVLAWTGRTLVNIIGGLILLIAAISLAVGLVSQSPAKGAEAGAKVGFAIVNYTVVAAGLVASYGSNVGPAFNSGRSLGDQQSANQGI